MHLNLFIPSQSLAQAVQLDSGSALARLLSRAKCETLDTSLEALICQLAGLERKQGSSIDTVPFAAICCFGEDSSQFSPDNEDAYFLFADPVHLALQRDSFSLSSPVPLSLSLAESEALLASLNQHFASDGLKFSRGASGHWYVQHPGQPQIATSHPELAINRDINAFLPQGPDAVKWNQLINEVQMLLFSHPVNEARESRGMLPCNSLWFWGGGKLPEDGTPKFGPVYSSLPLIKGLCRLAGSGCQEVPAGFPPVVTDGVTWISLDASQPFMDNWFQAAVDALRRGDIGRLHLYVAVDGKVLRASLQQRDLWKFWRKTYAPFKYFEA